MHLSKIILKNNKKFLYSLITKDFFDIEFFELLFEIDSTQKNDFIFLYKSQHFAEKYLISSVIIF